jgi:Ssp1 endopeptidase immunity protein Rap1a
MRTILALSCVLLLSSPALAEITGNQLHEFCDGKSREVVTPYIVGVWDKANSDFYSAAEYFRAKGRNNFDPADAALMQSILHACVPEKTTGGQVAAAVCKFVADNPDKRNKSGADLVVEAMNAAYPCK